MAKPLDPQYFPDEEWMNTAAAIAFFGVTGRTLRRWCQNQEIVSIRLGGTKYYPKKILTGMMFHKVKQQLANRGNTLPPNDTPPDAS